jgi:septum formation protein
MASRALWHAREPLVLASRSQARQTLLQAAGIPIEVYPADLDERLVESSVTTQSPNAIALHLACEKAAAVARSHRGRLTLGADQVLALEGRRFSKPADRLAARAQLHSLSGRTHEIHSAIAFAQDGTILFEHVSVARLTMRALSDEFLDLYLDAIGDSAKASVGAYQLENYGIQLFDRIEGDYFTVLGLPLLTVLKFLRQRGCLAQ